MILEIKARKTNSRAMCMNLENRIFERCISIITIKGEFNSSTDMLSMSLV